MSISTNISGATLKLLDDSIMKHKKEVLENIWNEYLKDKVDFDQFIDSLLSRQEKPKRVEENQDIELDTSFCRAKIWNHLTKTYHQCKFRPSDNNIHYCEKHKEKRNYGDF